jgi:hypothetical protein
MKSVVCSVALGATLLVQPARAQVYDPCTADTINGSYVTHVPQTHPGATLYSTNEPEGADERRFAIWGALRAAQVPQRVQAYTFELPPN